jgi:hypothetical protein
MPNAEMPMRYQYFLDAPLRWWRRSRDVVIPTRMSINASELQYEVPRADSGDETIALSPLRSYMTCRFIDWRIVYNYFFDL